MTGFFEIAVAIAIVALVIGAIWYAAQPRCQLLLALKEGRLSVVRGKSTASFLSAAQSICQECGLEQGEIRGYLRGRQMTLAFSPSIPPEVQQRLRNVWLLER